MIDLKKAIHLVSSHSAKGVLMQYFKTHFPEDEIKIHSIHDSLTVGPLNDFITFSDFQEYVSYWKNIEEICKHDDQLAEDYFRSDEFFEQFKTDFSKDIPLVIWHGNEAGEKLMLYRYCSLLRDRDLYEINLSEWTAKSAEIYNSDSLATRNPEHLDGVLNLIKKIDKNDLIFYAKEWERLKNDKKLNRILKNKKVISVEEDYYDQNILENCTSEFQKASRVIGETMGKQESTVGDHYLWYRIHVLINQNLLESRGKIMTMRDLEIRKK